MTDHHTNLRRILLAVGVAAVAAVADTAIAQSTEIHGTVNFEGGAKIPQGEIEIYFEESTLPNETRHPAAQTQVKSDGEARTIAFSFSPPASVGPLQIIARLEREDGWLLARGSAVSKTGLPVSITLNTVMY